MITVAHGAAWMLGGLCWGAILDGFIWRRRLRRTRGRWLALAAECDIRAARDPLCADIHRAGAIECRTMARAVNGILGDPTDERRKP